MNIRSRLRYGETVISDHHPYYATSQRIILYQEVEGREEVWELPYARVTSVDVVKMPRHKMMVAGTLLIVGGAVMSSYGFITSIPAVLAGIGALVFGRHWAGGLLPDQCQRHVQGGGRQVAA